MPLPRWIAPLNVPKHGNSKLKKIFEPTSDSNKKILKDKTKGFMAGSSQV